MSSMVLTRTRAFPASELRDPLYLFGRGLFYMGLLFSSLLVFRVSGVTIGDALLLASIGFVVIARVANQRTEWTPAPFPPAGTIVMLTVFVVSALLATADAMIPQESLSVVVRLVLVVFLLPWIARVLLPDQATLSRAAAWLVTGAALSAAGTILQYMVGPEVIPGSSVSDAGRFSGFTGIVSDLGGIAAMGLAIGLGFILGQRRRRVRFWATMLLMALATGLILSGSVSGMIATVVAFFVYLARRTVRFGQFVLLLLLGGVTLFITSSIQASSSALDPIGRLMQTLGFTAQGQYSTSGSRIETYEAAWNAITTSPLAGRGFDALSSVADGVYAPHNLIIGAMFQGGVLVALVIVLMLLRVFRGRWLRHDRSPLTTQLVAGAVAAIVFAMTAPSLYNRYLWVPIALLAATQALRMNPSREEQPPS